MKKILPFIFGVLFPLLSFAQITLEHAYPASGAGRVKLEIDGIKYYYVDTAARKLLVFNEDHSPWKTIPLHLQTDSLTTIGNITVTEVSQTKVLADARIEFILSYDKSDIAGGQTVSYSALQNEDGVTLLDNPFAIVNMNGSNKLVQNENAVTFNVYALPGLVLEHQYLSNNFSEQRVDGITDAYTSWDGDSLAVYKDDHTLWRKFFLHPLSTQCFLRGLSQTSINPDPGFEALLEYTDFDPTFTPFSGTAVYNEQGIKLYGKILKPIVAQSIRLLGPDEGFTSPKLLNWVGTSQDTGYIYALPALTLEKKLLFFPVSSSVEQEGIKLSPSYLKAPVTSFSVLNAPDYSSWHDFTKPAGKTWRPGFFTRHVFDVDNDIEFGYATNVVGPLSTTGFKIHDESNGQDFFVEDLADAVYLSSIPGAPLKLISIYSNYSNPPLSFTKVYNVEATSGLPVLTDGTELRFTAAPNPGQSDIFLDFARMPEHDLDVQIHDLSGRLIYHEQFPAAEFVKIPATAFPGGGAYLLEVQSGLARTIAKILRQ
jgi:hypothetical protein